MPTQSTPAQSITLFFTEGSSDKVYHVDLVAAGDAWSVNFRYGRRGGPMKAGTKTATPVPLAKASAIYAKLVAEKTAKGYTPSESGAAFTTLDGVGDRTGFRAQLLNTIARDDALAMLAKEPTRWVLQTKHDGERRMISWRDGVFEAANRKGLRVSVDARIETALARLAQKLAEHLAADPAAPAPVTLVLDGEDLGDRFVAFNVLEAPGGDLTGETFSVAAGWLEILAGLSSATTDADAGADAGADAITVDTPIGLADKSLADRLDALAAAGQEGAVLRDLHAATTAGRPASGGGALKLKFVETATVRVRGAKADRRSVQMEALDDGQWIDVGAVTVPANLDIPAAGALIEVRYLYAHQGGALFQPVMLRGRDDLDDEAASVAQFKYKGQARLTS